MTRRGWAEEAEVWLGSALGPEDLHVMYDASDALGEVRPLPKLLITSFKMASRNHQFGALSRRQWASVVVDEALLQTKPMVRRRRRTPEWSLQQWV